MIRLTNDEYFALLKLENKILKSQLESAKEDLRDCITRKEVERVIKINRSYQWKSVADEPPTQDDADKFGRVEVYDEILEQVAWWTWSTIKQFTEYKYWRKTITP